MRSLVVAKIEKPLTDTSADGMDTTGSGRDGSGSDTQSTSMHKDGNIEITFNTKVEYLGPNAQTIAFLKREDYPKLDLNGGMNIDKVLDVGIS